MEGVTYIKETVKEAAMADSLLNRCVIVWVLAEYDNLGHYKFVLKFGFQNDDNKNYGCSFPITTETGLLLHFAENVLLLNKDNSFESCMLNGRL